MDAEISIPIIEALHTTELPKYMLWPSNCAAAERGVLIKKNKRKECSWVKFKTFLANVGRPNNLTVATNVWHQCFVVDYYGLQYIP